MLVTMVHTSYVLGPCLIFSSFSFWFRLLSGTIFCIKVLSEVDSVDISLLTENQALVSVAPAEFSVYVESYVVNASRVMYLHVARV